MKKALLVVGAVLVSTAIIIGLLWFYTKSKTFYLEEKYYGDKSIDKELELKDIESLIKQKESFIIFVYQPLCTTSEDFSEIITNFSKKNNLSYYKIAFSEIKDSKIFSYIKYYPSFIIFKDGEMVDYLDAESDEDIKKYKDEDEFAKWLKKYVRLKPNQSNPIHNENNENDNTTNEIDYSNADIILKEVKREENKVNIYFFWGDGCPHCKEEKAFFEKLQAKFGSKYNLYMYEVWKHQENQEILNVFADALDKEVKGVPFTVIGDQVFSGFNAEIGNDMIDAINKQYKNSYDVYFDDIIKGSNKN